MSRIDTLRRALSESDQELDRPANAIRQEREVQAALRAALDRLEEAAPARITRAPHGEVERAVREVFTRAEPGARLRARPLAQTALGEPAPTQAQVESVRVTARRLVTKGFLVKNDDASFS